MNESSRNEIAWVGLDAHKETIAVAMFLDNSRQPKEWEINHTAVTVRNLARKLRKLAGDREVRCCYEAGPLGFTLQRKLQEGPQGIVCEVIAPSLIPNCPGDRVKTDRRDALKLAIQLRAGALTEVRPPTREEEAVRDLCRCREDAVEDRKRARNRVQKFLLRREHTWTQGSRWTQKFHRWLRSLKFEQAADQTIFDDYLRAVEIAEDRVERLTKEVSEISQSEPYGKPVGWLRCFRGIDTVIAMTVVTELHGFERFRSARELMSYLGLTPSESSSGQSTSRGGITKTGNGHVRRMLVEAAHCQRNRPTIGRALKGRRKDQPEWVISVADRAMTRLHGKFSKLKRRKHPNKAVTAVARELAGFLWAVLSKKPSLEDGPTAASAV